MLLPEKSIRDTSRSTQQMTVEKFKIIVEILKTSIVLNKIERSRRPKRGGIKYSLIQMILVMFYIEMKRKTFDGARVSLKDTDVEYLAAMDMPRDKNGNLRCPSKGQISWFINRVWPTISEELFKEIREAFLNECESRFWTCDSTPLEASRYNTRCRFNPHYNIRMDKCHIIMCNGHPMYHTWTDGLTHDNGELLKILKSMNCGIGSSIGFATDGIYDTFDTYADVYSRFGVIMASNNRANGVFHKEITWEYMQKRYAKLWEKPEFKPTKFVNVDFILRFMYNNGEKTLVGKFLRNLDIRRGKKIRTDWAHRRHVCEEVHKAAKRWINFDVRGLRKEGVEQRVSFKFFTIQIFSSIFADYDF